MKRAKEQRGSITLFVLVSCLFFITFLIGVFILSAAKRQAQIEASEQTKEIYERGEEQEIYEGYFGGDIVPIYTKEQLEKMCSGEQISIKEEGGKIYTFGNNSVYELKNDIYFEYNGIWQIPTNFGEIGRIEGNGKKIIIKDTSRTNEEYYYYTSDTDYKYQTAYFTDDGAIWVRVLYQNNKNGDGKFTDENEALNCNMSNKYSILAHLEEFRSTNGKFEFLLQYPEISGYNRWLQTSNPCTTIDAVTGYEAISISWSSAWSGGLTKGNNIYCLLDGQIGTSWWYSVASYVDYHGGMAGPYDDIVTQTALWVRYYDKEPAVTVDEVTIPNGYVASQISTEDSVEEGLVIYEGTEPVTEENHATALTSRNQYVWIPVEDINSMVMCESNNKLADGEGNKICNLVYDAAKNELKCTNEAHTATATNLVGRLYTSSFVNTGNNIYKYEMDFTKRDQTYNTSGYREPDDVPDTSNGDASSKGIAGIKEILKNKDASTYDDIKDEWNELLQSDFTVMAKSVAKYGGFYISRYEIGRETVEEVEVATSKKGQPVLTAASTNGTSNGVAYLGADMWYGLYKTIRDSGTNKQMIWGCQYDQVIKFLKEKGEEPETGHNDIGLTTNHALSGQNEQDCMRNIYDLEGNHGEWTAEAYYSNSRDSRGSSYGNADRGKFNPAIDRLGTTPTSINNSYSSRSTLYL